MNTVKPTRQSLFRWIGWFFFFNTLLAFSVIFYYHNVIPDFSAVPGAHWGQAFLGKLFFVAAFLTQATLFMYFPAVICLLIAFLVPRRFVVFPLAIFLATVILFGIVGDAVAYGLYFQHYLKVFWHVYQAKAFSDVLVLDGREKIIIAGVVIVFLALESILALAVWRAVQKPRRRRCGHVVSSVLVLVVLFTYGLTATAVGVSYHQVLKAARVAPYFSEVYNLIMPGDRSARVVSTAKGAVPLQVEEALKPLHYPLKPLSCQAVKTPLNIVVIGIDTWRYDEMNAKVTPAIYQFAQKAIQFNHHYSGGNCTRPGVFTLFYGLPANYWRAFLAQHRRPVLINQLMKAGYQMGIFMSAPLTFPAFNQSIFEGIKGLVIKTKGNNSLARDKKITQEFKKFLNHRDSNKPFFSFLFYDAVHNYCEPQVPSQTPFTPYIKSCNRLALTAKTPRLPYLNRYRNAVYFDDQEIAKDLAQLKKHGLLKNTIVIITSDHGEQINDEGRNIWVHASAYTPYQMHVPFIVYWPGKAAQEVNYFTSHYDMAPTLMKNVLACTNPFSDYAVGQSLLSEGHRPFIIVGSYGDYAVVVPGKQATRVYPNGDWQVDDKHGQPIPNASLNVEHMQSAYLLLNRFFSASSLQKPAPL